MCTKVSDENRRECRHFSYLVLTFHDHNVHLYNFNKVVAEQFENFTFTCSLSPFCFCHSECLGLLSSPGQIFLPLASARTVVFFSRYVANGVQFFLGQGQPHVHGLG